jgi:hypothetical protein
MREKIINKFDTIYERNIYYPVINVVYFNKFFQNLYEENSFISSKKSGIFSSYSSNSGSSISYVNPNQSNSISKSDSNSIVESNVSKKETVTHDAFNFFRLLGNGNVNGQNGSQLVQSGNGATINSLYLEKGSRIKSGLKSNRSIGSHRSHISSKGQSIKYSSSQSEDYEESFKSKKEDSRKNSAFSQFNESENGSVLNTPTNTLNTQTNLLSTNNKNNVKPNLNLKKKLDGPGKIKPKLTFAPRFVQQSHSLLGNSISEKNSFSHKSGKGL